MTGLTFSGLWYLEAIFAQRMHGIIVPRLQAGKEPIPLMYRQMQANESRGESKTLDEKMAARKAVVAEFYDDDGAFNPYKYDLYNFRKAGGGQVAVVPISGAMSREGGLCAYGNEYTARILETANTDPKTQAVVLKLNTPGGTVDSTKMLADTVKSFSKPIIAWTPFCASAGYYVASQTDEIWMEEQSVSQVGSIGVLMVYANQAKQLENEGLAVEIFRADGSQDKARINGIEPLTDELRAEITDSLNVARREFVGYVRRGRTGKLQSDEVFSGKMYGTKQALSLGLADRSGTLDAAIKRAIQLSK